MLAYPHVQCGTSLWDEHQLEEIQTQDQLFQIQIQNALQMLLSININIFGFYSSYERKKKRFTNYINSQTGAHGQVIVIGIDSFSECIDNSKGRQLGRFPQGADNEK